VTEKLLDGWVGRYVSMRAAGGVFRGRVETVGSDGIFFQITTTPDRRRSYPPCSSSRGTPSSPSGQI
jgi:hypothetical protein